MAVTGPIPKREDQRVRRNTSESGQVDKVVEIGKVTVPDLGIVDPHPLVKSLYEGMKKSAQRKYYEPSDWEYARVVMHFLNQQLYAGRPSAQMLAALNSMMQALLLTEGDRRRVRIEVERQLTTGDNNVVQVADLFRQRLEQK